MDADLEGVDKTALAGSRDRLPALGPVLGSLKGLLGWCGATHAPRYTAALAIALTLPALWVGFAQDDYFFLATFKGSPGLEEIAQPIWNTFTFSEGDPARNRIRMERGILPWWGVEDWKIDLWRPVASFGHWVDYRLFGETAWPMHAHSLLLYGLVALLMALLYRRLCGAPGIAGLMGLLFAVDAAHGLPVGWLSNRNALLAVLFGLLSLLAHHRWRETASRERPWGRWFPFGPLACIALAVGLFSCEAAIGTGAYFLAYSLFVDPLAPFAGQKERGPFFTGALRACTVILPYLAVVIVWRLIYTGLGHGVRASWLYFDPLSDPGVFLRSFVQHFPVLMLGLFGVPDSMVWIPLPAPWKLVYVLAAVVFLTFSGWCVWPLLKNDPKARFWALGSVLAVIPACATAPFDRLLFFASIGAMGLAGLFIGGFLTRAQWVPQQARAYLRTRVLVSLWVAMHLVISPILLLASSYWIVALDRVFTAANDSVPIAADGEPGNYVIIATPLDYLGGSLPVVRSAQGAPVPEHWRWLSAGDTPVEVERVSESALILRPEDGFLKASWSQIFRRPQTHPMRVGDRVRLEGMEAEVLAANEEGRPLAVRFTFDRPLEDPSLTWLTWVKGRYVPYTLPEIGASNQTPGLDAMHLLRLALGL